MKKIISNLLAVVCAAVPMLTVAACDGGAGAGNSGDNPGIVTPPDPDNPNKPVDPDTPITPAIKYTDNHESSGGKGYNKNLFYRNNLDLDMGDPMLVYDNGVFYALGTRSGTQFDIFRSTNLSDWEKVEGGGFMPRTGSWGTQSLWAPDIQKIGDKWYLYYTANYKNPDPVTPNENHCQIGVAVADSPEGPYKQWEGKNADDKVIGRADLPFYGMEHKTVLDQHVFQDDDGELYMYFSYDSKYDENPELNTGAAEIYGVRMKDPVTWDLSTLTRLVSPGYKTLNGSKSDIDWETWSPSFDANTECAEGPYMIKKNGKYILTYCANSFVDTEYAVGYAVSDSPLGNYEKPDDEYLQNMICGVPARVGDYVNTRYLGFTTGTGHASVCKVGDEYLLAYHAHYNRDKWGEKEDLYPGKTEWRAIGFDYILFDDDGLPYANGPTYSLVKLPDAITGYTNLAPTATVEIDGTGKELLTDNRTNRGTFNPNILPENYDKYAPLNHLAAREAQFKAGTRTITLTFAQPVTVKAVNVYNSYDYAKRTTVIAKMDFGKAGAINNLLFNENYINDDKDFVYPHSAYNIELTNEVVTDTITITIECDRDFAVSEIEVLGKL